MSSDEKFWLGVWITLSALVVSVLVVACEYNYRNNKQFIDGGYTQEYVVGSGQMWVKHSDAPIVGEVH